MRSSRSSLACFFYAATIAIAVTLGRAAFLTADEPAAPIDVPAEKLVEKALAAEAAGDAAGRSAILSQALATATDNSRAHWADGQVRYGGQWLAIDIVEESAAHDPVLTQYREQRSKKSGTPQADLLLAVWCEQHNLDSEAKCHWRRVLELDPQNPAQHEGVTRTTCTTEPCFPKQNLPSSSERQPHCKKPPSNGDPNFFPGDEISIAKATFAVSGH